MVLTFQNVIIWDIVKKMKRQATDWEERLAKHVFDTELTSKIHKESENFTIKK